MPGPKATSANTSPKGQPAAQLQVALCDRLNYASWQNSVPLLQSVTITNPGSEALSGLTLEFDSQPAFARPRRWILDRIAPGSTLSISDRELDLDAGYLAGLTESERAQVSFRLLRGPQQLTEFRSDLRVLARHEWGGYPRMAELLAAFVLPNDPAIAALLRKTAEVLTAGGHSAALDGYQSADPARAFMLVASLWSAASSLQLIYANPPASFESEGQKIRLPGDVISSRLATCLDSTLLFAAALEAIGLHPVIVLKKGHCFVGVWITRRTFGQVVERDVLEVRKALQARELLLFESTLITFQPKEPFKQAQLRAEQQVSHAHDADFVAVIDVQRARLSSVIPLSSPSTESTTTAAADQPADTLPLPALPSADQLPVQVIEERPTTPDGRIQRWQRKLLDLSLRNRLLNFRSTKHGISFLCPSLSDLEDYLSSEQPLAIISLPERNPEAGRDVSLHRQRTGEDLHGGFAAEALKRGELSALLPPTELSARLTDLFRRSRNDLAEGGSNTLFLVMGFLRWKKSPTDDTSYTAPLLLIPVRLKRSSAVSGYQLERIEDDTRINSTLLQMIRRDFEKDLTWLEGSLPADQSGIDVARVLQDVRAAIRDIPGFEVLDEAALATFSFVRYLMWKDLADRLDQLQQNRVVRHLTENPDQAFSSGVSTPFPRSQELDRKYRPHDLVHPLPADSSQLAAMVAAAEGQDFVLIGPPGTGKSQTIANIIAQCLALKKTVLFVAEKTAALEVVYRRLQQNGLGELCLELHSSRAERRKFLQQLQESWVAAENRKRDQWDAVNTKLRKQRDELNGYVEALHRKAPSEWSIFQAMGVVLRGNGRSVPKLTWPDTVQHSKAQWDALTALISELAVTFKSSASSEFPGFLRKSEWSPVWENELLQRSEQLEQTSARMSDALAHLTRTIGIEEQRDTSAENLEQLNHVARSLIRAASGSFIAAFAPDFPQNAPAIAQLQEHLATFRQAQGQTTARYSADELPRIPVDQLDRDWREATVKFWPLSVFARRRVRKLLQTYATDGLPDPAIDLPLLRTLQQRHKDITGSTVTAKVPGWQGLETDPEQLGRWLQETTQILEGLRALQRFCSDLPGLLTRIGSLLSSPGDAEQIKVSAESLAQALSKFSAALQAFKAAAGGSPGSRKSTTLLADTTQAATLIRSRRGALRQWVSWHHIRTRCEAHGLSPFVEALENGSLLPDDAENAFPLAWARWWLPLAISREPLLLKFRSFSHEAAIAEFRRLDEQARAAAGAHVARCLNRSLPAPDQVPRKSELGLLRHQMELKRPSASIREMVSNMPESFATLAPCVLMSPLSIAQYLPAGQQLFDVVIFDEASQITTWDAIGAIARGRQTIIVGDPKQLPPTSFFSRADSEQDSEELEEYERDLESILDEARASGLPTLQLTWHYRSQHESLIAFSNWHYYDNQLITFPSVATQDQAVRLRYIDTGVFDRGGSRTNRVEAEALTAEAVARMQTWLTLPEDQRPTLGVITFNQPQQKLIEDLFDRARTAHPELEWFFDDARTAPTIVKNLENVQGDERDVILFSIAFGFDQTGRFTRNFGALNRDGGQRRLNVAVTRARQEMIVFTSFRAEHLSIEGVQHQGVVHLKNFLDYAERGPKALPAMDRGSVGSHDSPFEEAVAERLRAKGWEVVPQIGVSRFRIDLGVINPDAPGAYLAGIECDGATYHSSATARDRDVVREHILRNLGWNIIRIWSPEWWHDSERETEEVHKKLTSLLTNYRTQHPPSPLPGERGRG
jgi:very-short-patch-repair endonuclease